MHEEEGETISDVLDQELPSASRNGEGKSSRQWEEAFTVRRRYRGEVRG